MFFVMSYCHWRCSTNFNNLIISPFDLCLAGASTVHPPKPIMHRSIAYSHYFSKIDKSPPIFVLFRFCFPSCFDHDASRPTHAMAYWTPLVLGLFSLIITFIACSHFDLQLPLCNLLRFISLPNKLRYYIGL